MAPRPQIKAQILQVFVKRAGQTIFLDDLSLELDLDKDQIRNGINNLRNGKASSDIDMMASIQVISQGNAWVYNKVMKVAPAAPSVATTSPRHFEEVGTMKDGSIMVRCEANQLYRLVAM